MLGSALPAANRNYTTQGQLGGLTGPSEIRSGWEGEQGAHTRVFC